VEQFLKWGTAPNPVEVARVAGFDGWFGLVMVGLVMVGLWLVLVWRVVSLVIGFAGWILAGRSLNADQDDVECRYTGGPN
jgi:hypothetical protein